MKTVWIPVFFVCVFGLLSCTKSERSIELFKDFSSTEEEIIEIKKSIDKEVKPVKTIKEEKKPLPSKKPEMSFVKKYHIGYLAFDVADILFEVKPTNTTPDYVEYRSRIYSKTNGTVDYFMGWLSNTVGYTKIYDDKTIPVRFRTKTKHKKKTREIELAYDASGKNFKTDKVTPPDNRKKRPAVTDKQKRGAYDPLSAFFEIRRMVKNAYKNDNFNAKGLYSFSIPVYDGRRRTDFLLTLEEKKHEGNYKLTAHQKAVAGYTKKEMDKDSGNNKTSLVIMINPKDFTPVEIIGKHPLGTASADYIGECEKLLEECVKG